MSFCFKKKSFGLFEEKMLLKCATIFIWQLILTYHTGIYFKKA